MGKMESVASCKLGKYVMDKTYESLYGIKCKTKVGEYSEYLSLFLWAYKNSCIDNDTRDCSGTPLCNLENILGKLTQHCRDCKPKKYKKPITEINGDYSCWYSSDEYIDCLNWQLINEGYIEPAIDLCANLNIEISMEDLCKEIVTYITLNQTPLSLMSVNMAVNNLLNNNN
jgi:hypothetical protein